MRVSVKAESASAMEALAFSKSAGMEPMTILVVISRPVLSANTAPVYELTALSVMPSYWHRMIQYEVTTFAPPLPAGMMLGGSCADSGCFLPSPSLEKLFSQGVSAPACSQNCRCRWLVDQARARWPRDAFNRLVRSCA
jgi:hypothetical protein